MIDKLGFGTDVKKEGYIKKLYFYISVKHDEVHRSRFGFHIPIGTGRKLTKSKCSNCGKDSEFEYSDRIECNNCGKVEWKNND